MVQDYKSAVKEYEYPFEYVMEAYQRRFGENGCPDIPIIKEMDVKEDTDQDGVHNILRRCRLQPEIPGMLRRMMGIDSIFFCQRNVLDRKKRTLTITAWNESFDNRVKVEEVCKYWAEGDNLTKFTQEAKLTISSFWGFESTVEKLMIRQYTSSMKQGKEILQKHLKQMNMEKSPVDRLKPLLPADIKNIDEIYLQRFINSRDGNVERAASAAKKFSEARKTWNVEELRKNESPQEWSNNFDGKWLGRDNEGGPVLVLPLGKIGVRTIQKSLKEDEIIRQIIKLIEQRPNPDVQFSALIDCHDVCLRQGWVSKPVIDTMLKLSEVLAHLFPDSLRRVLLIRAPAPFTAVWSVVSPLIDEKTRAKVWLYSGSDNAKNLRKFLQTNAIPTWLGGEAAFDSIQKDTESGYVKVTLPYEETVTGLPGSMVHWDVSRNEHTAITGFTVNGRKLTEVGDLCGAVDLDKKSVVFKWDGSGEMGLFIAVLPAEDLRGSISSLDSFQSGFSLLSI